MAEGFVLNIDDKMLQKLEKADHLITDLATKSEQSQKRITAAFREMGDKGVGAFIRRLDEAARKISSLNFNGGNFDVFSNVNTQATETIDAVNKLAQALSRLSPENQKRVAKNKEIEETHKIIQARRQEAVEHKRALNEKKSSLNEEREITRQLTLEDKRRANQSRVTSQQIKNDATREVQSLRQEEQQLRANTAVSKNYANAMLMSETTLKSRVKKIERLKSVLQELSQDEKRYADYIDLVKRKMAQLSQENKRVEEGNKRIAKSHRNLIDTSGQLARGFALLFSVSAIRGYINKLIEVRGEFELQKKSLESILHDKDEVDKLWNKTIQLAVKSPFRVGELVSYTKQLAAYRVETEKLYDTNKMLADVSAGLGVDMQRLILAFGQVKAANYLRGTELRQFSEAGINILGELSKYFTELEGRAISVGDVFEMVSKRMVSFANVEEVFKRITSEGGMFYKMQETQAETLKGQMSNLKDSIDIMLDSIGRANESTLKGGVAAVREFVESWREVAQILKEIIILSEPFIIYMGLAKLSSSKLANGMLNIALRSKKVTKGLDVINSKIDIFSKKVKIGSFGANVLKNALGGIATLGIGAAIGAIVYGILELWRVSTKASREAAELAENLRKIYTEDTSNLKKQQDGFENLVNRLKSVNLGSEEHRNIISKINSQYGEYLGFIANEATSYDTLKDSIERVNKALLNKSKMSTYEKALEEVFKKTNKQINEAQESLKNRISSSVVKREGLKIVPTEKEINDIFDLFEKRVRDTDKTITQWSDFQKIFKEYGFDISTPTIWYSGDFVKYSRAILEQKKSEEKIQREINGVYKDTTANTIEHRKALDELDKKEKERLKKAESLGISSTAYKKEIAKIKQEIAKERIEIQVKFEGLDKDVAAKRIAELNKFNNTILDINKKIEASSQRLGEEFASRIIIDEDEAATGIESIAKNTAQAYEAQNDIIEQQNKLKAAGTVYDQKLIDNATKAAAAYKYKLQLLGRIDLIDKGSNTDLEILKKQLNSFKDAYNAFKKNKLSFGTKEAKKRVQESFNDLFKELKLTDITKDMDFDELGIIKAINQLPNIAGEKGRQAKEKMLAEFSSKVDLDIQVQIDKNLRQNIEDMFSGYEMSLELEKINITPDFASELFDLKTFNLDDIRDRLFSVDFESLGDRAKDDWLAMQKKLTDAEDKAQVERLKKYTKYLIDAKSERVKIKLQELKEINEVESENKYSDAEKEDIKKAIRKNAREELDKQDWKEFQGSELYIKLFQDLEYASSSALDLMESKLLELKNNLKGLSPTELKVINEQLDKIAKARVSNNPLSGFIEGLSHFKTIIGGIQDTYDEFAKQTKLQFAMEEQVKLAENLYSVSENDYNLAVKKHGANSMEAISAKILLDINKKSLNAKIDELVKQKKITEEIAKQLKEEENIKKNFDLSKEKLVEYASQAFNQLPQMASDLENVFGSMDASTKDTIDSIAEIGGGITSMAKGIMDGNPIAVLSGLTKTLGSIFAIGDKKKERQIQREIKLVENLQYAYEKLEKSINEAYSIDTMNAANSKAKQNLQEQIQATQRMINAEESKKKTDKKRIEEWQKDIDRMKQELEDLEKERLQALGGFGGEDAYKSAAEEFANAWYDAFKETGHGLNGLEESFDEFIDNVVKKQLLIRGSERILEPLLKMVDSAVNDAILSKEELSEINMMFNDKTKKQLDALYQSIVDNLGVKPEGGGNLSGLQKGIQGITEETAQIIEAYLNSIRFFVSDDNMKITRLVDNLTSTEIENPIVSQLKIVASQTTAIRNLLDSLTAPHPTLGGRGLKMIM